MTCGAVNALLLARGERRVAFAVEAFSDVRELTVEAVQGDGLDRTLTLGAALFAAFLLGWLAGWLTHRAGGTAPAPGPDNDALGRLAAAETATAEAREELRDFFEVDAKHVVLATLYALQQSGKIGGDVVAKAMADLGIDPERAAPVLR